MLQIAVDVRKAERRNVTVNQQKPNSEEAWEEEEV